MIIVFSCLLFPVLMLLLTVLIQINNSGAIIWWSVPLALLMGIVLLAILFIFFLLLSFLLVSKKHSKYYRFVINQVCVFLIIFFGINIKVKDFEKLPKEKNFFLVCNHLSNLDPIIQIYCLKKYNLSYIMKKEVKSIPFVGEWLIRAGFLILDRKDNRQAALVMVEAIKKCEKNEYLGVFPEGTRSKTGEILELKSGVFKIPKKAGVPIVISYLFGSNKIKKNFPFKKTNVFFELLDIISLEDVNKLSTNEISDKVASALIQKNNEFKKITN